MGLPFSSGFTQTEIDKILNQEDLVLRNLQITLGYYRIAQGLRGLIGDQDVNWFCFGCYASKTAGQALRHELIPKQLKGVFLRAAGYENVKDFFDSVLKNGRVEVLSEEGNILAEIISDVSILVSEGNYMIFSELALPYSIFIDQFSKDMHPDWMKLEIFLDKYLDPRPIENGGQAYLREAFSAFYSARFETDLKKKAEWVLLGNLMTGFHEQTRVQSVIEKALAAPFDNFTEELLPEDEDPDFAIEKSGKRVLGFYRSLALKIITQMWMTYALPGSEMKLGEDVELPMKCDFPNELIELKNPRTFEVVCKFDKDLNSLDGSAAENWGSLDDRMTFLADFFRSYQHYQPLFNAPFTEEQIISILADQVPDGQL